VSWDVFPTPKDKGGIRLINVATHGIFIETKWVVFVGFNHLYILPTNEFLKIKKYTMART